MRAIEEKRKNLTINKIIFLSIFIVGFIPAVYFKHNPTLIPGTAIDAGGAYIFVLVLLGFSCALVADFRQRNLRAALACGQYLKVEAVLNKKIAGYKNSKSHDIYRIQNLVDLATIYCAGGRLDEAEEFCRDAMEYAIANAREQQEILKSDEPIPEFTTRLISEAGLRANTLKAGEACCLLGEILAQKGKYVDVQACVEKALNALQPIEVFLDIVTSQEELPGGEKTYREVPFDVALDFQKIDIYECRESYYSRKSKLLRLSARVYELAGESDKAQSKRTDARTAEWKWLEAAESLVKEKANHPKKLLNLANCHISMERFENAIEALDRALKLSPPREFLYEILLKRADCLRRRGQLDKALDDVEKVLKMVPESTLALLSRAEINDKRGLKDKAIVDRQKAESLGVQRRYTELA